MKPKKMSVAEFRRLGYLQELNRKFLHPLGLAIEVNINDDGTESFGEAWDYRDDPEGMSFDESMIDDEFIERARRIHSEFNSHSKVRERNLGYTIQPALFRRKSNE